MTTTAPHDEVAARRLARQDEETRALLELGWWWVTEPNPPCVRWCTRLHEAGEYADGGTFVCSVPVGQRVRLVGTRSAVPGPRAEVEPEISFGIDGADDLVLGDIAALVDELHTAAVLATRGQR